MRKMLQKGNNYKINSKIKWTPGGKFPKVIVKKVFDFSYGMSFEKVGEHRDHRSGGEERRKPGKIFIQTFQGKLAEFGIYNELRKLGLKTSKPNLELWGLGTWDTGDLIINDQEKISIKSTKHFGNLCLLETKDWNKRGEYLSNIGEKGDAPDFLMLVRLFPDGEKLMSSNQWLYNTYVEKNKILEEIQNENWEYDCPGFITKKNLISIINEPFLIPKGAILNDRIKMDAENYYIQAGDFYSLKKLEMHLQR